MRFRRRTRIFPGVYLNFSKSGISTTIGPRGANVNFNKQGTFLNTGIPGTGIYDRKKIGRREKEILPESNQDSFDDTVLSEEKGVIRTEQAEATTSKGLEHLKKELTNCYQEREELKKEIVKGNKKLKSARILLVLSYILLIGLFIKWFKQNKIDKQEYLNDLEKQLDNCFIDIQMNVEESYEKKYLNLLETYRTLLECDKIWDLTSATSVDQKSSRSAASTSVTRKILKFGFGNIYIIKSKYDALHFENANGGDIYIYPAFIAIVDSQQKFGLIDIRELDFSFHGQRFLEEQGVPEDAEIVGNTWAKVNKNGQPDKRFKDNYQIPVCNYGEIHLKSITGLNEAYSFSNYDKSRLFSEAMNEYQEVIK